MDLGVLHFIIILRDLVDKRGGSLAREGNLCFGRARLRDIKSDGQGDQVI